MEVRPTLARFKRHVELNGTDAVMETAVRYLDFEDAVALQGFVDEKELEALPKKLRSRRRHRTTPEQRVKKLLGIEEDAA